MFGLRKVKLRSAFGDSRVTEVKKNQECSQSCVVN